MEEAMEVEVFCGELGYEGLSMESIISIEKILKAFMFRKNIEVSRNDHSIFLKKNGLLLARVDANPRHFGRDAIHIYFSQARENRDVYLRMEEKYNAVWILLERL